MSAVIQSQEISLRPMTLEDVDVVIDIENRIYEFPWTEGIFRDCLHVGYCCWIIEVDGQTAGYAIISVAAGEAHLLTLVVAIEFQGQGFGRLLLKQMLSIAHRHGAETIFLEVRPSNTVAIGLYNDTGFNEIGIRPNYYPAKDGREDALIMAMTL